MGTGDAKPGETAQDATQHNELMRTDFASAPNSREEMPAAPCISAYYSDARVRSAAFVKSVRSAKIRSFDAEDSAQTLQRLSETDPTLARTVALLGKGPDVVARWVVRATKASLDRYLPGAMPDEHEAAKDLLDRVVRMSVENLAAKDKHRRARAQNLLRLVLAWLMDQRNLSPTGALLAVRRARKERADRATAMSLNRDAMPLLRRAKLKQLTDLSLVAALFESAIAKEAMERKEISASMAELRDRIRSLDTELRTTQTELKKADEDRTRLSNDLAAARKDLRDEKELEALQRTHEVGRFKGFLVERVSHPLSDARDALDFDPPHLDAARQRIEMAMRAIRGEMEKSNE